jgi:hypothetical protein
MNIHLNHDSGQLTVDNEKLSTVNCQLSIQIQLWQIKENTI